MARAAKIRLDRLLGEIGACRICRDSPQGAALPHEPRPVLRVSTTARIGVFGQAPGTRVHATGVPFSDPSGERLRAWMGVTSAQFYDASRVAVLPMGFCFPGLDAKGGDRPPRRECAPTWREKVLYELPELEVALLVGRYAQVWHLADCRGAALSETVADWRRITAQTSKPQFWPLPHPSWRNNSWLKKNPWFEAELLPQLQHAIARILDHAGSSVRGKRNQGSKEQR